MRMKNWLGARTALVGALLSCATPAFAEEAIDLDALDTNNATPATSNAVMVRPFEGPRSQTVHDRVQKALEKGGLTIVPVGFEAGVKLSDAPGPYVQVAQENGIRAYVHGTVKMGKSSWTLTLRVRNASTGEFIGEEEIKSGWLPGLLKAIDKQALTKLQPTLDQTNAPGSAPAATAAPAATGVVNTSGVGAADVQLIAPPGSGPAPVAATAPAAPAPAMDPISDTGPTDEEPPAAENRAPLNVEVGGGGIIRMLSYTDAFYDTKRQELFPHGSPSAGVRVGVSWYPGAHGGKTGWLSNLGVNAHFIRSLGGVTTAGADKLPDVAPTNSYETVFQEIDLGVRARVPMGGWELGFNLGWGNQQMGLIGDNALVRLPYGNGVPEPYPGLIPDIDSTYYRFGADIGFSWFDWDWMLGLGMRTPDFSAEPGQIANQRWFPNVTGFTATAEVGVVIPVFDQFSLSVLADLRQTGLDMNSSTSSIELNGFNGEAQLTSSIAGGAVDRYAIVMASVRWSYGGPASASHSSSDSEDDYSGEASGEGELGMPATGAPAPAGGDTSNPDFFGGAAAPAAPPAPPAAPAKPPASGGDTSNPDFFQ